MPAAKHELTCHVWVVAHLLTAYPPVSYPVAQDIGQKYQFEYIEGHLTAEYSSNPNETHLNKLEQIKGHFFRITWQFQSSVLKQNWS